MNINQEKKAKEMLSSYNITIEDVKELLDNAAGICFDYGEGFTNSDVLSAIIFLSQGKAKAR